MIKLGSYLGRKWKINTDFLPRLPFSILTDVALLLNKKCKY